MQLVPLYTGCVTTRWCTTPRRCSTSSPRVTARRLRWGYTSCIQLTNSLKPPGFNPRALNSVEPQLEAAWFQPLSLSSEKPVSSLCIQMKLVPLHRGVVREASRGARAGHRRRRRSRRRLRRVVWMGHAAHRRGGGGGWLLYTLNSVVQREFSQP
jgi:hypothetical protein